MPGRWGRKTLALVVACGAVVGADDGPPPLEPPTDLPPVAVPTPPAEESVADPLPDVPPENRPILVVPGLPTPRRLSTPRPTAPRPAPAASADPLPDGPPPLTAPTELGEPAEAIRPLPRPAGLRPDRPNTLTLEPVPADGLDPLQPAPRNSTKPDADNPPRPAPPPRRGILGRLMRPAPPRPAVEEPIRVEPRDDPAADAALKRRIEAQVRRTVGDKTRSIEVRVVDRRVYIRAQVERFWQKRAVRRTLETLPAVAGYKTVVDVVE